MMEKNKRSGVRSSLFALMTALCLVVGGSGTALAEPSNNAPAPDAISAYIPGGFIPGADGKAWVLGWVQAKFPEGTDFQLSSYQVEGAKVKLYKHPTTMEERKNGTATPVAEGVTDENGVFQIEVDASSDDRTRYDMYIEYDGAACAYGNRFEDDSCATYIHPKLNVRPILSTEANVDESGQISSKKDVADELSLNRDQAVDWNTYLIGHGTDLNGDKTDGFGVDPIEKKQGSDEAFYNLMANAFKKYGAQITATDEDGNAVDLDKVTSKAGTYKITYKIGFELPGSIDDPLFKEMTSFSGKDFTRFEKKYNVVPEEGNRMIVGESFLMAHVPYKLSYNANGGEGAAPDDASFMKGDATTLAKRGELSKAQFEFIGWNTQADGRGKTYAEGQEVTFDADTTLYAQWKKAPVDNERSGQSSVTIQRTSTSTLPRTGDNTASLVEALALFAGVCLVAASTLILRNRKQHS